MRRVIFILAGILAALTLSASPALADKPQPSPSPTPTYSYTQCQTVTGSLGTTELCVTVEPTGTANPDSTATVLITVSCASTYPAQVYYGNVRVWQDAVGPAAKTDQILVGSSASPIPCDGTPDTYPLTTRTRGYHPGSARVIAIFSTNGHGGVTTVQADTGDYQTSPPQPGVTLV